MCIFTIIFPYIWLDKQWHQNNWSVNTWVSEKTLFACNYMSLIIKETSVPSAERQHSMHSCCSVAQSRLMRVWLLSAPWTAARQAPLSFTISWSLPKLISIQSEMPSNHLILCFPLLLLPSVFPSIRVFQWISYLHQVDKILVLQLQGQSCQWVFRVDFL